MADIVFPGQNAGVLNSTALPANHDLVIYKGDTFELLVNIKDVGGNAIDVTGSTPKAVLKTDYTDRMPTAFTIAETAVPGQVLVSLTAAQTKGLLPGSYIWDLQVTYASGLVRTYIAGDVTVLNEVTE